MCGVGIGAANKSMENDMKSKLIALAALGLLATSSAVAARMVCVSENCTFYPDGHYSCGKTHCTYYPSTEAN
jgi:hypothetical protein